MATQPRRHKDYAVGWICALPKEQTAAKAMLDQIHPDLSIPATDDNAYTLGSIGEHNIVIACLPKHAVGTNEAAIVATQMFSTFPSIKIGLMVGIGGGIPPKVRLGDVVVGTEVIQWDFGKAETNFKRTGVPVQPPRALRTSISKLQTEHDMREAKISQYLDEMTIKWPKLVSKYTWSESLEDPYDSDHSQSTTVSTDVTLPRRKRRDVCVHYGLIASGNQVIKNANFRDNLNESLGGDVLCVEMEAAGLMNFPYIVIRGICDYADVRKNDRWQEYAAAVAAAYAKELLEYVRPSEIDRERPLKDILDKVLDSIVTVTSKLDKKEDLEILNWLTPIDYDRQQNDFLARRQPGTGQWLLKSPEYETWLNADKQILFCPGIPGAGKTILTSAVVNHLTTCNQFSNDSRVGIAYIYCNFKRKDEQKSNDLLASLLKQLAQSQPSLPKNIKELYKQHKAKRTHLSPDEIFENLQSIVAIYSRVFIVVDALDECQSDYRAKFLSALFQLHAKYGANIFATSRYIPEITNKFKDSTILEILARDEDVRSYLDGRISESNKELLQKYCEDIKTEIVKVVHGMFLLAQLHFESVRNKTTYKMIKKALKILPMGKTAYDSAYETAMDRIQGQDPDSKDLANRILSWITCAKRPLTTSELRHALAVEVGEPKLDEDNLPEIKDMVSVCAGLVTVDEGSNIIRLVHYTTQEYFERTWRNWFPNAHIDITETCVTYLSYDTFNTGPSLTDKDFEARLQSNFLYDYAARNWGYHAYTSSIEATPLVLSLLESETRVSACTQAMLVSSSYSGYSQRFPKHMTGLHLTAYVGILKFMTAILSKGADLETKDGDGRTPVSYAAERGYEAVVKLLVDKGADLEAEDSDGRTPLLCAAENGHEAVVKLLVDKGADLEAQGGLDRTPLLWAAGRGHEAAVKLLVDKGADLEAEDSDGQKPLSLIMGSGHKAVVKLLVDKGADLEGKDSDGRTPLLCAAENGHEAVVKLLVDKGVNLEGKDSDGRTPLLCAAENGHEAVVKLLVDKGVNLEAKDSRHGRTPVSYTAERGYEAVVKLLMDRGADLEAKDSVYGQTPLSCAAENGHEAVVKLLVDKGADLEGKDSDGWTPLSWAAGRGHEAVVKLLVDKGADLEAKDSVYGETPLSWAAENGREAVVKLLVDKGADLEAKGSDGRTPVSYAAERGHEAVVKLLVDKGADLEAKGSDGRTPVSYAAESGYRAVVKLLIDKGADLEAKDSHGRTPVSYAAGRGRKAVVKLLADKGADLEAKGSDGRTPVSYAAERGYEAVVKLLADKGADLEAKDDYGRTPLSWTAENVTFSVNAGVPRPWPRKLASGFEDLLSHYRSYR